MSDHALFLKTIIDHPSDDGPRLVYADWLEEQGDPRGEFIRVQVELAKLEAWAAVQPTKSESGLWSGKTGQRLGLLRSRERELLQKNRFDWEYDFAEAVLIGSGCKPPFQLGDKPFNSGCIFRRGFIDSITCPWADWGGGECQCVYWARVSYVGDASRKHPKCDKCVDGRLPGHATAILAAQPVTKVKLTTRPGWRLPPGFDPLTDAEIMTDLKANWPGIEFELPATGPLGDGRTAEDIWWEMETAESARMFDDDSPTRTDDLHRVQDELSR